MQKLLDYFKKDSKKKMSLECKVRARVREIQNGICSIQNEADLLRTLKEIHIYFFPKSELLNPLDLTQPKDKSNESDEECKIYMRNHYANIAFSLLDSISVDTIGKLYKADYTKYFLGYFLNGSSEDAFLAVTHTIYSSSPGYKVNKCVTILEQFLTHHGYVDILQEQTGLNKHADTPLVLWKEDGRAFLWDSLILEMGALPDKMANKLKTEVCEIFLPKHYIPLVIANILTTLATVNKVIRLSQDCSLEFISRIVGKLCSCGHAEHFWSIMLKQISGLVRKDYIWSRIFETIITGVPDRCMESVLVPLVRQLPWYGLMDRFLGNIVMYKPKIQLILCTKLIFHRYYKSILVLQNVIGYLATATTRQHLFLKLLLETLQVWGDSSTLSHMSHEQHVYLTQALLVCMAFLKENQIQENKDEILRLLMPGVQAHIGLSDIKLRKLGMLIGEVVTQKLEEEGPKLKFEYEEDEEIRSLKDLLTVPPDPFTDDVTKDFSEMFLDDLMIKDSDLRAETAKVIHTFLKQDLNEEEKDEKLSETVKNNPTKTSSDLDSDDDLEPYDMSEDTMVTKVKQPKYIRDCMEGLIGCDKPDTIEACLGAAETLIRSNPTGLEQISAEFAKVLLHLTESFGLPNFRAQRFNAMVALAVTCPKEVAEYLTSQFYNRNYSLRQRLDVIEVIGTAAQELSRPTEKGKKPAKSTQPKIQEVNTAEDQPEHWKEIVQKRIESKTRRFAQGSKKPVPAAVENRFAAVAGYFFYPLMKNFDRQENTFDLMGEDCFVLARLMYTLGIVIYAASNIPNIRQMAVCLLEFIWVLRFHSDASVRQGLLFAMSMIYLAVPSHILLNEIQIEVFESKNWLEDVIDKDVDSQCKTLAVQALVLLENLIKQEFWLDTDKT